MIMTENPLILGPVPIMVIAQAAITEPWVSPLVNGGALVAWVLWLLWRDKRESEKKDQQHKENQESLARMSDGLRSVTLSIAVAMEGMKSMDRAYHDLAERIKATQ